MNRQLDLDHLRAHDTGLIPGGLRGTGKTTYLVARALLAAGTGERVVFVAATLRFVQQISSTIDIVAEGLGMSARRTSVCRWTITGERDGEIEFRGPSNLDRYRGDNRRIVIDHYWPLLDESMLALERLRELQQRAEIELGPLPRIPGSSEPEQSG